MSDFVPWLVEQKQAIYCGISMQHTNEISHHQCKQKKKMEMNWRFSLWFLQDRRCRAHRLLLLCGGVVQGEARRTPQLAVHVLDDWRDLCLSYGLGHHPTLW